MQVRGSNRPSRVPALVLALVAGLVSAVHPAPSGAATVVVSNTTPPTVLGDGRFGSVLEADPGTWQPDGVTLTYQWFRDGEPIVGADARRYRPALGDIGSDLLVEVTGHADGADPVTARSDPVRARKGLLVPTERPGVTGRRRFGHTLTADAGSWSRRPDRVRYQWLRGRSPVEGATHARHPLRLADFGRRLQVQVTVRREGYRKAVATSPRTRRIMHRVPARHMVTYRVETRGHVTADLGAFKTLAQQTYDDPRGWRGSGIVFARVARGGDFTLVLSEAGQVPSFSSECSSEWSCRVGRFVVINQTRWQHASPMWHRSGRSLRDYRHMVVNHETGHWLGHGHRGCPGAGALAPVMQQQSKGLAGCRPNPWPTAAERRTPRFG